MAGENLKQDRHREVFYDFTRLLANDVPSLRMDMRGPGSFRQKPKLPRSCTFAEENNPRSAARMLGLKTPRLTDKDGRHPALVLAEVYIHRRTKPQAVPPGATAGLPASQKAVPLPSKAQQAPAAPSITVPQRPFSKPKLSAAHIFPAGGQPSPPRRSLSPHTPGITFHLRSPSQLSEATEVHTHRGPSVPPLEAPSESNNSPSSNRKAREPTSPQKPLASEVTDPASSLSHRMTKARSFRSDSWKPAITMQQFLKVKGIFDDVDPDGKGKVALRDLLEFSSNNRIPNKVFARMTLGNDGTITLEEMVRCFHPQLPPKDIRATIEHFLPQLHSDWREKINEQSAREIAEVFRLYDEEGRGSLSLQELADQLRQNECLTQDALVDLFDDLEMDPDAPLKLADFESLLRDYYIQEQHSEGRYPTLDFLTHQKRATSVWAQYFPRMPEPDVLLRPSTILPVLAPTIQRADNGA
eukprot:GGOE01041046.1.p1 GENE.GGOE01041046.1~~GGOE01041046.1.p1  ORF type:complete len:470 (+),score=149.28 GGOE01041046.1:69-1478(+)